MYTQVCVDLACLDAGYSNADYAAIVAMTRRNGGIISKAEIFSVIVTGHQKLIRIIMQLEVDGHLKKGGYYNHFRGPRVFLR